MKDVLLKAFEVRDDVEVIDVEQIKELTEAEIDLVSGAVLDNSCW